VLRVVAWAAGRVSRRSVEPLARFAGRVTFLASASKREAIAANLRQIYQRPPTRSEVRAVFEAGALNYWDTFAIPQLSAEELEQLVDSSGWEHLEQALAAGKGAIVVGAHLGSIGLAAQVVVARGYRATGVVEPVQPPELFDFFNGLRESHGIRLLPVGASAGRELLGALRRNEVLCLITDRDVLGTGPTVDFFGAPTTFADGAAVLSVRTGAPVLAGIAVRQPDGRFRGTIEPIEFAPTGDARVDVLALTASIAARLQYHVGSHPEQWTVFQRRWPEAKEPRSQ
jgi:KDO2-lipid IV(A) lauroyltransferase